ncbi:hypothetical protein ACFVYT_06680 [Streptomyces sp. NPDC058290]|uniref:hypothetical protein n=1 Tax=Streptomyces sp. NPDC058290 TaxID=3346426 RepID=UPI0036E36F04
MTHPFRMRRMFVFAASTAAAAGAVLLPTGAFAATPATAHTVVSDGDIGSPGARLPNDEPHVSNLLLITPKDSDEGRIIVKPDTTQDGQGQGDVVKRGPGKVRPGKNDHNDDTGVTIPEGERVWICVTAPCGPPSHAPSVAT